ncbi:hypothetical protein [Labrenzia sp. PHM005]|uniref:hypothetical protein n=1 Tax=Labrenzia sp. PHM005 TaxID=2590016 RepID=UPI00113FC4AD|nr:hypothetical protein [Labrenzia sp. PHM005]QDG78839.1 hypothetical protein FJ695_24865 [Labrenzia sp. PHM005]
MRPEPENVQSLFITRYRHEHRVILLFRIGSPSAAQSFLSHWASTVNGGQAPKGSYADTSGSPLAPVYHFAFNWQGTSLLLKARNSQTMGLDPDAIGTDLETFFTREDNAPYAPSTVDDLSLNGLNTPENWWAADTDQSAFHIAMLCYFADEAQKTEQLAAIRTAAAESGLTEWQFPSFQDKALSGKIPHKGILHFGFRDGISKVDIDWKDIGEPGKVDFREVLLGYSNETYPTNPVNPGPWNDFVRDGTYLNLAWLYQDVASFNRFLKDNRAAAETQSGSADPEEWLAAKLMGRWRNGSALATHPNESPDQADLSNDFGYANDGDGETTPLHSHIRVCNPRDQALSAANQSRFAAGPPRLVRRGFSYGPPLEGTEDDGQDRGLIGVFACARINEQFYTVLRWIQRTEFSDHFDTIRRGNRRQDMMFGLRDKPRAETTSYIPSTNGVAPLKLPLSDFIRYKGLAIFFAPSLKTLTYLAGQ